MRRQNAREAGNDTKLNVGVRKSIKEEKREVRQDESRWMDDVELGKPGSE